MRLVALLLLLVVSTFVGSSVLDACPKSDGNECPPACHLACLDGCTVVPLEVLSPALTPLGPTSERQLETAFTPLELTFLPEIFPPKA